METRCVAQDWPNGVHEGTRTVQVSTLHPHSPSMPHVSGTIPSNLGSLTMLTRLALSRNRLTGEWSVSRS